MKFLHSQDRGTVSRRKLTVVACLAATTLFLSACSGHLGLDEDLELTLGVFSDPNGYPTSYEDIAIRMAVDEVNAAALGVQLNLKQADPFTPPVPEEGAPEEGEADEPAGEDVTGDVDDQTEDEAEAPTDEPEDESMVEPTEEPLPESEITSLIEKGVNVILAPQSLAITEQMVQEIVNADIPLISTAVANPESYAWVKHGLFFNAAPTSRLLGQAIAETLTIQGQEFFGLVRINDFYTTLVKEGIEAELVPTTGQIVVDAPYAIDAFRYNPAVDVALNMKPPTLIVLAGSETSQVLNIALGAGYPAEQLVLAGINAVDYGTELDQPITGALAVAASFLPEEAFVQRLETYLETLAPLKPEPIEGEEELELDTSNAAYAAAARAYDNVILIAMAAYAGGSAEAQTLASQITARSGGTGVGNDPVAVTSYEDGVAAIRDGKTINYDGVSGGIAYDRSGEVQQSIFSIHRYNDLGALVEPHNFPVPNDEFLELLPEPLNASN